MDPERRDALLVFAGVLSIFLSLAPYSIAPMGYAAEEIAACRQILSGAPVEWPRHGAVGLVFQCPLVALGKVMPARADRWEEIAFSIQPAIATALIVAVTFVWCRRLSGDRRIALLLALGLAFGTMLWPYAYVGLETTQSLFLLLAGFAALSPPRPRPTWPRTLAFAACAAVAVSAKSNGAMLLPAVAYLAFELFRRRGDGAPLRGTKVALAGTVIAAVFVGNALVRARFWERFGGFGVNAAFVTREPAAFVLNLVGFLGSPGKGLIVFAPIALLALILVRRAATIDRGVATFAVLTLAGLACGCALLDVWTDETWGPRYLHAAIAPLVLCLAAADRAGLGRWRRAVVGTVALGFAVSILGVLFPYGAAARAAVTAAPVDLEMLQGNPRWNAVRFNARLLGIWISGSSDPVPATPGHPWSYREPVERPPERTVDVRAFAVPQPLALQPRGSTAMARAVQPICAAFLLVGIFLLAATGRGAAAA
jgi:hypothetical protein